MDDFLEILEQLGLPEVATAVERLAPIDLSEWNVNLYYEAMGIDFEEPVSENGDL